MMTELLLPRRMLPDIYETSVQTITLQKTMMVLEKIKFSKLMSIHMLVSQV